MLVPSGWSLFFKIRYISSKNKLEDKKIEVMKNWPKLKSVKDI